ncbi:MAG: nucleoid-associated protein, partial [Sphingobacteriales bacterium]|nr:nucleoid-associated protein [Sphingobacteriales bacterium]
EQLGKLLMQYFLKPFEKINEVYRLSHSSDNLALNELFHFADDIFKSTENFHNNSIQIARHLYDISTHPKIKSGELYVTYFTNLQIEGELHNAIGIFKSETKETYLKVNIEPDGFTLSYEEQAINIKKLDKGCVIFNTEKEEGYKVCIIDQTNSTEAAYWIDDFLNLKIRNDNYNQTSNTLSIYKKFVTTQLDDEFEISATDKIDLLNKSIKYFKEKETFDIDEFSNEVIGYAEGIASFKDYKKSYEEEFETEITDSFQINNAAVKKQARLYKSILKLDKNFHIYIHGNKEMIEKGFDEEKNLNYYKVYYREEQ